ncbi:MAG: hypothetical protein MZU91_07235 [Desulfosudis oleivorans]|nr:hypothetical protein [Desulfosudis oleivorans]
MDGHGGEIGLSMDQIHDLTLGEALVLVDNRDLVGQTTLRKRICKRCSYSARANHDDFAPINR